MGRNSYYYNQKGDSIPANVYIEKVTPTDTTFYIEPENGTEHRINLSGQNSTVERFTGEDGFVKDTDYKEYWIERARQAFNNRRPGFFENLKNKIIGKNKQGGAMSRINYFEDGGATQTQQAQAEAFMKALLQGDPAAAQQLVQSAMQKDAASTKLIKNILEADQQGNAQVSKAAQAIRQVMQQIKGQTAYAKWGSKLSYIRSLKYAKGGKACPACEKGAPIKVEEKACGGKAKKAKKRYFGGWL